MTSKFSERWIVNYKLTTRTGSVTTKSMTVCAGTEEQARMDFDKETAIRSRSIGGNRVITSVTHKAENERFSAEEDFYNRYGVQRLQYENE